MRRMDRELIELVELEAVLSRLAWVMVSGKKVQSLTWTQIGHLSIGQQSAAEEQVTVEPVRQTDRVLFLDEQAAMLRYQLRT